MIKRFWVIFVAFGITLYSLSNGWDKFVRYAKGLMIMMGSRRFHITMWCVVYRDSYQHRSSITLFLSNSRNDAAQFARKMIHEYTFFFSGTLKVEAMWTLGQNADSKRYSPEFDDFHELLFNPYVVCAYDKDEIYHAVTQYWYKYVESKC